MPKLKAGNIRTVPGEYPDTITVCGVVLHAAGRGKYPYSCIHQDENPDAMIYESENGGWDCIQSLAEIE